MYIKMNWLNRYIFSLISFRNKQTKAVNANHIANSKFKVKVSSDKGDVYSITASWQPVQPP